MKIVGRVGFPPFELKGQGAWDFYGQDVVEIEPEKPAKDPVQCMRDAFAGMSVEERTAQGPGRSHLHPKNCRCYWCETAGQRYSDYLKEKALEW